jgi:RNA polymerase sigma factor (sigma-70 family)
MQPQQQLAPGEERALVLAARAGDADACRELVEAFLPAIAGLARRFPMGIGVDRQELVHEGVTGLLFAARRYDAGLGTPFWAYASFRVRKAMQELVAQLTRPVALSDRAVRGLAQIRRARIEHLRAHGAEPTNAELGSATGFTPEQLASLLATERMPRGLEERLRPEEETTVLLRDSIADPLAEHEYEQVLDEIEISHVHDLARGLDERARAVIRAHYGLGQPPQTLSQIGGALGLTAERARQIEAAALSKLRDGLAYTAQPVQEPV